MIAMHNRVAVGRLDSPEAEHDRGRDPEFLLDPRQERRVLLQHLLAGDDAPVGDATVEVLPELLTELRLVAKLVEHTHVGLEPVRHAGVGRS